ncbi:MAG TPA: hemerythrin domain-containing protein [Geodermatophilus sp.]|nr:hemerythrin domain-containing protein [Geodermatophilus sp.]
MTAAAVAPPSAASQLPPSRAVAYERVLHRTVCRELRTLAELATWAPGDDADHTAALGRHAGLLVRVLLQHHRTERDLLWPALLRSVPAADAAAVRARVTRWADRCAGLDNDLRDLCTAARQWAVAQSAPARDRFALACLDLADALDAQTAEEERELLPLLAEHLPAEEWTAVTRAARCDLSARERLLVLGLVLEDASPGDRARLLSGLPRRTRLAWRLFGRDRYRAAVVRLRGAPPAH